MLLFRWRWRIQSRYFSSRTTLITKSHVVIVGGGPTGLMLSNLLSSYGTPSVLLEAQTKEERFKHPQAHFLNTRTMEILRYSLPEVYQQVQEKMNPVEQWNHFQFGSSMTRPMARVHHPVDVPLKANTDGNGTLVIDDMEQDKSSINEESLSDIDLSSCSVGHLAQHHFCRILWEAAKKHCDGGMSILAYGTQVTSVYEDNEDPNFPLLVHTNDGFCYRSKFVVAADGAHSMLRRNWNIGFHGQPNIQSLINVHIKTSENVSKHLNNYASMLYFIYNPSVVAVVVGHSVGDYVLQIPYFPPYQTLENDFSHDKVLQLVQACLGLSDRPLNEIDVEILSVRAWNMGSLIAEQYISGERCILAGDSAHVFPPAGGLGMNTGLQDVHNLAWRLSLLHHCNEMEHVAGNILRRYETERRPIAQQNAALSVRNFNRTLQLAKACYLDHRHPSLVIQMLSSPPTSFLPMKVRQEMFRRLLKTAMFPLAALQDNNSSHGKRIQRGFYDILARGEGLPLLFPKYELGFGYAGAVHGDNASETSDEWQQDTAGYSPRIRVGYLLPYAMLSILSCPFSLDNILEAHTVQGEGTTSEFEARNIETTDLPAQLARIKSQNQEVRKPPPFVVLSLDCSPDATKLLNAAVCTIAIDIKLVEVQSGGTVDVNQADKCDHLVLRDETSQLHSMLPSELEGPTIILVRPDGHVAGVCSAAEYLAQESSFERAGAAQCWDLKHQLETWVNDALGMP